MDQIQPGKEKRIDKINFFFALLLLLTFGIVNKTNAQNKMWEAPKSADNLKNPLAGNTEILKNAKVLYINYCAPCHGTKGKGDGPAAAALNPKPANHTSAMVQSHSDGALYWMMTQGHNPMPAYKTILSEKQRWELVEFIRSLAANKPKEKPAKDNKTTIVKEKSKKVNVTDKTEPAKDKSTALEAKKDTTNIKADTDSSNNEAGAGSSNIKPNNLVAQESNSDSSLLDRINTLEEEVAHIKPGDSHLMVAGLLTFGYVSNKTTVTYNGSSTVSKTNNIGDADHFEFSPMFLWRHGKNFLMEFEPSFSADGLGVNWAAVSYYATPGLIVRGGYLVLPFGAYSKRLAAGWINKLASDPEGVPDATDFAVEAEGGLQAGTMKWSYDFALSNGMQLKPDGTTQFVGISDNNKNKTFTGRIGWLPLSNSSLELGASIMTGKVGDAGLKIEHASANLYALDLNLIENLQLFQINIKGQYSEAKLDHADYINLVDSSTYSFDNQTKTGYIMAAVRPMFSQNKVVKNFEIAARYGNYTSPANSLWGTKDNSLALSLNYWINWRTVARFSYEEIKGTNSVGANLGGNPGEVTKSNSMYLQFCIEL